MHLVQLGRWVVAAGVALAGVVPPAGAQTGPDPTDVTTALLRQVCDLQWIEGACAATGYPDPQYRSDEDPSPGQPFALRIGVVHEHSGYSDGDPDARPADYFRAAKEGHNVADVGGDTGIVVDFLLSSEHSENEKLPITTAEVCIDPSSIPDGLAALDLEGALPPLKCSNVDQGDAYRKWAETMAQAIEATDFSPTDGYTGFTALRGFEWTNDYYNHLGVYFSRNVVNAKIDGSYLSMDVMWDWLQEPAEQGGGSDALVVFNHPGGFPALSPFDGDLPHNQILQATRGGANWDDVTYVPAVDDRVVGMEVNGGDDLSWYVRALTNGWHIGPVAAEDEHQREWSTTTDGKTLVLTRGRGPRDYYVAFQQQRTVAVHRSLLAGAPGEHVRHPSILFWADGADVQDPAATVLGGTVEGAGDHDLHLSATGLPAGSVVALVPSGGGGPVELGAADGAGAVSATQTVSAPASGEAWWFAVVCPPGTTDCGTGEAYDAVTAPIWLRATASSPAGPLAPAEPAEPTVGASGSARLPATGSSIPLVPAVVALAAAGALRATRRRATP